jgi:hypothetical protein
MITLDPLSTDDLHSIWNTTRWIRCSPPASAHNRADGQAYQPVRPLGAADNRLDG